MSILEGSEGQFVNNIISTGIDTLENGFTALHFASAYGWMEQVNKLVHSGAGINIKDTHYGETPLHFVVKGEHIYCVRYLLAHGADIWAVNDQGLTPLDIAKDPKIIEVLQDYENGVWDKIFDVIFT